MKGIKLDILQSCCILLYNNKVVGTGWVVKDYNLVISAGHLFTDGKDCISIDTEGVNVAPIHGKFICVSEDGENNTNIVDLQFLCGAYQHSPLIDYCLLRPTKPISIKGLPLANKTCWEGNFYSAGYGRSLATLSNAEGQIIGHHANENGRLILKLSSEQSCEQGYSGAPIYSERASGVIGIQSEITPHKYGAESKTILAYPIEYLLKQNIIKSLVNPSLPRLTEKSDLDAGLDILKKGDSFRDNNDLSNAKKCYNEAKKCFIKAVGEKGVYVDAVNKRIRECSFGK